MLEDRLNRNRSTWNRSKLSKWHRWLMSREFRKLFPKMPPLRWSLGYCPNIWPISAVLGSDATIAALGFISESSPTKNSKYLNWDRPALDLGPCLLIPYFKDGKAQTGLCD